MAIELTVGSGKPNMKTQNYRVVKERAIGSGFRYLDNIAFTPSFFNRLLEESGAMHEKENHIKRSAICYAKLNKSEIGLIKDAIYAFPDKGLNRLCLFVRSDEPWDCAGTGLGSSHVAVRYSKSPKGFVDSIVEMINLAIASQFDDLGNVEEFKRIKGVSEKFGIMLMPVHATSYPDKNYAADRIFAPSLSANFLGKVYGRALMQCARGFFYRHLKVEYKLEYSFRSMDMRTTHLLNGTGANGAGIGTFLPGNKMVTVSEDRGYWKYDPAEGLDERIGKFLGKEQCYLEAVRSDHYPSKKPDWALTQYAPAKIIVPKYPDVGEYSVVGRTSEAIGTSVAYTEGVRIIHNSPGKEDIAFNRANKGYLVASHVASIRDLVGEWPLAAYSNAGAIVLACPHMENVMLSHVSGYLRELGKPILIFGDTDILGKLDKSSKHVAFANEFSEHGFIAMR